MSIVLNLNEALSSTKEMNRFTGVSTRDYIRALDFSPDGKVIIASGWGNQKEEADSGIRMWSRDGAFLNELKGHKGYLNDVRFSPDGQIIASASDDGTLKLWDTNGMLLKTLEGHSRAVTSVAFSPDGQLIVSGSIDESMKLWTRAGGLLKTLDVPDGHGWINDVEFSPNGQYFASASDRIRLWDREGKLLKAFDNAAESKVEVIAFSPDGKLLVSAAGRTITIWSHDGRLFDTLDDHKSDVTDLAFHPNGTTIASASCGDSSIRIWKLIKRSDAVTGSLHDNEVIRGRNSECFARLRFDPDGVSLASSSHDVRLWHFGNNAGRMILKQPTDSSGNAFEVRLSPDNQWVAIALDREPAVELWRTNGEFIRTIPLENAPAGGLAFGSDSKTLASASLYLQLWSVPEGKLIRKFDGEDIVHRDNYVSVSSDGRFFASANGNDFHLWSADGEHIRKFSGHGDIKSPSGYGYSTTITSIKFSPDNKLIASASLDNTLRLWTLNGDHVAVLEGHKDHVLDLSFSGDGKYIVSSSSDHSIIIWDVGGKFIRSLNGHTDNVIGVRIAKFSPESEIIISNSSDQTVRFWTFDGRQIGELELGGLGGLEASPDGKLLLIGRVLVNLDLDILRKGSCEWLAVYLRKSDKDIRLCEKR